MLKTVNKTKIIFILVLAFFCISRCLFDCFPDYDLWTRFIVGSSVLDGFSLIKQDFFSYLPTHTWYDHEWGASVIIYAFFKAFHQYGILLLKCILSLGIIFLIYATVKLKETKHSVPYNILFYAFAFMAASYVLCGTIRCHLFSFFFFTLFLFILENVRLKGYKQWWIIPSIMLFWANIHGACVSGLGLLIIYIIGEKLNKKPVDFYLKALLTSCLVFLINPWGIDFIIYLTNAILVNKSVIAEWLGTFQTQKSFMFFKIYLFIMIFTGIFTLIKKFSSKENTDKTKLILIAVTTYLSITHLKQQPFFVITSAIFLYDDFYSMLGCFLKKIPYFSINKNKLLNIKEIFAYIIVLLTAFIFLIPTQPLISITQSDYPYYTIEFIKQNNLKGNLLIDFQWGSYAEYKLFPNNKIGLDGRYEEIFDTNLFLAANNFYYMQTEYWDDLITVYPPDLMIIKRKYPVYKELLNREGWNLVLEDKNTGLFISDKLKKDKYIYPTEDKDYYERTKFDKNFNFIKRKL